LLFNFQNDYDSEPNPAETHGEHINVRAALIHVLGDLLQSIGVLISSIIIKYKPEYKVADPICTVIFAIIIFCTTITILRDTLKILMEGLPSGISYDLIRKDLLNINGVINVHDLKIWAVTVNQIAGMVHIVAENPGNRDMILAKATKILKNKHNLVRTTIQIEDHNPVILDTCNMCRQTLT
jgi:zinc transporter 2